MYLDVPVPALRAVFSAVSPTADAQVSKIPWRVLSWEKTPCPSVCDYSVYP